MDEEQDQIELKPAHYECRPAEGERWFSKHSRVNVWSLEDYAVLEFKRWRCTTCGAVGQDKTRFDGQ